MNVNANKFKYALGLDCETSGLFKDVIDPSVDLKTGNYYQIVSIGLIVVDMETLNEVEELYLEIKWDGKSLWSKQAENVHGLSKEYLEKNGYDESDAVCIIGEFILKYFENNTIPLMGHNVVGFDRHFIYNLFKRYNIDLVFGSRHIDTFALGVTVFKLFNSSNIFSKIGINRAEKHNSLDDIKHTIEVVRVVRTLWESFVEPHF